MVKKETVKTDTESRILQAAEEEFLLKGLEGARTTAIAERAGVTHAMLHYYFRTKNMLFERIIEEKMRNAGNIMQAVFVLGDMPLMERVKRGVEQHFDFIAANPNLPRFVIQEIYSHPERHEIMRSQHARRSCPRFARRKKVRIYRRRRPCRYARRGARVRGCDP